MQFEAQPYYNITYFSPDMRNNETSCLKDATILIPPHNLGSFPKSKSDPRI